MLIHYALTIAALDTTLKLFSNRDITHINIRWVATDANRQLFVRNVYAQLRCRHALGRRHIDVHLVHRLVPLVYGAACLLHFHLFITQSSLSSRFGLTRLISIAPA